MNDSAASDRGRYARAVSSLGLLVLARSGPGLFEALDPVPEWARELLPHAGEFEGDEVFPFLSSIEPEAEAIWEAGRSPELALGPFGFGDPPLFIRIHIDPKAAGFIVLERLSAGVSGTPGPHPEGPRRRARASCGNQAGRGE